MLLMCVFIALLLLLHSSWMPLGCLTPLRPLLPKTHPTWEFPVISRPYPLRTKISACPCSQIVIARGCQAFGRWEFLQLCSPICTTLFAWVLCFILQPRALPVLDVRCVRCGCCLFFSRGRGCTLRAPKLDSRLRSSSGRTALWLPLHPMPPTFQWTKATAWGACDSGSGFRAVTAVPAAT